MSTTPPGYFKPEEAGTGRAFLLASNIPAGGPHQPMKRRSEWRLGPKPQAHAAIGVTQAQLFGMQHQTRMSGGGAAGIKRIAENGVPEGEHMDPQLVAAPGLGGQSNAGFALGVAQHPPIGERGFAGVVAHFL